MAALRRVGGKRVVDIAAPPDGPGLLPWTDKLLKRPFTYGSSVVLDPYESLLLVFETGPAGLVGPVRLIDAE